jgi:arylsulfatase A-like enzyme
MESTRPNILFICTDQQRYDSLGVNGNPVCQTPNLDRLAAAGMNFTRAFTVSSLCSPARASLLTGLYPHNHGMTDNCNARQVSTRELSPALITFPQLLKYRTGYVGKWHVGQKRTPLDWGFDDYIPGEGWHEWWPEGVQLEKESAMRLPYAPEKPMAARVPLPLEAYPEYQRASAAIALLEGYARQCAPFLLCLDFFAPHYPHYLPEPYASMYDPAALPRWVNFADALPEVHEGTRWLKQRWGVSDWETCAEIVAAYYGHVTCLDHQIGRVLEALDRMGLARDTLVVFTSDHGDLTGAHGILQKGAVGYDELYRIPLIARWPGVVEMGVECDGLVELSDLMPTLLEVAGVGVPQGLDGRSMAPLLQGGMPMDWRQEVFAEYLGSQNGDIALKILRTAEYKLVLSASGPDELFDLKKDPGELENRIGDPAYGAVRRDLAGRLHRRMRISGDPMLGVFADRWPIERK